MQSWGHYNHFAPLTALYRIYYMATRVPSSRASVWCTAQTFGPVNASAFILRLPTHQGPPSTWASEASAMDPVPAFLLEIIKYKGWFVSQCMRKLSHLIVPKGSLTQVLRCASPWVLWSLIVIPRSEIAGMKPPYVRPGCFIHTYSNNMINRFHVQ
jgi:hypothetical protein